MQKLLLWFILPWQHLPFTGVCETHKGQVVAREGSVGGRRHGLLKKRREKTFFEHLLSGIIPKHDNAQRFVVLLTEFFRQSSSTSKLDVSVGLLTSGM